MINDRLVAHRGYQKRYPENTLLGYEKAIAIGAHFIETDIHFTSDGEPVLFHDLSMKRVTGQEGIISAIPFARLNQYSAHEPGRFGKEFQGLPLSHLNDLVSLLEANPKVTAFVEIKETALMANGYEKSLKRLLQCLSPVMERAVLISFDHSFIGFAASNDSPRCGVVINSWDELNSPAVSSFKPDYVFCDIDTLPHESDQLDSLPFTLVVYEAGDSATAKALFDRGVDMVETFNIGGLLHDFSRMAL